MVSIGNSILRGGLPMLWQIERPSGLISAVLDGAAWLRLGTSTGVTALYSCEICFILCPDVIALKPNQVSWTSSVSIRDVRSSCAPLRDGQLLGRYNRGCEFFSAPKVGLCGCMAAGQTYY